MKRSIKFFLSISILSSFGFLYHYNNTIHNDYSIIFNEVKEIDEKLNLRLGHSYEMAKMFSKRKISYIESYEKNEQLGYDAWHYLYSPVIAEEIYGIDKHHLSRLLHPYYTIALESKDSILQYNYVKMALIDRNKFFIDSLVNESRQNYTIDLHILNAPAEYKVGREYLLRISTFQKLNLEQNKVQIQP